MNEPTKAFQTFEDLEVYQVAREFRKAMYAVSRRLPECEKYGLRSQIQRAAVSLTNNIAEEHGRYHYLGNGYMRYLREKNAGGSLILHDHADLGFGEDELDSLLDDSTVQRFNGSTI